VFDGHRGETLIGQSYPVDPTNPTTTPTPSELAGVILRVVGPDGIEVYAAGGVLNGDTFVLPADGRYTFILQPYGQAKSGATIWDYADAPADVQAHSPGGHPTCTYGKNSTTCSSGGFSYPGDVTATTFFAGPAPTVPTIVVPPLSQSSKSSGSSSETSVASIPHG